MQIDQVEIELASYLASKLTPLGIDVVPWPQVQAEYQKPFERPKVTVIFSGEKGEPNQSLGAVAQNIAVQWGFHIQASKLRDDEGVYKIAEDVKRIMIGYRPTDCDRLYYISHEFVEYSDNTWEHRVLLECKTMRAEYQDYTPPPLLKKVDFIEK